MWFKKGPRIKATKTNGYASKLENAVNDIVEEREKAGELSDVRRQHKITFPCGIGWKVDFSGVKTTSCTDLDQNNSPDTIRGRTFIEAKGFETETYVLKKRMYCGCPAMREESELEVWKGSYKNPQLVEIHKSKKCEK